MNIFLRELNVYKKSIFFWSIGIIFLLASGMAKYEATASTGQINDLIAEMPKSLQVIMGAGALDLSKASGYFAILVLYLYVMATIHAAMLGATIIAKEERDKTAEFLFVKPVSRSTVITAKLLSACVNILIFNIITWVSSLLIVGKYSHGEAVQSNIAIVMISMFVLQLLFLVIGTAIAAVYTNAKKAASLATAILLLSFLLSIAIDLNDTLQFLKYLTPFKYYEAKNVMYGGGLDISYVMLSTVLIVGLTILTYVSFKKRDLHV
ncbi:ABC transporter permease subunit [Paenibacillus qinlingensis]|uniref:ABC-2 type transport system permease protein n=1 Tax=Paenibacillus qinlingensis TaxID=1837343 RepID=A0ABU1NWA4_9BACL|nr:ABC transporter permease subunit [Paenibacillus qinlingensis]MDR6551741.1 ABC-2 type transport system permease protein [Paenibacillus qinlingensis]